MRLISEIAIDILGAWPKPSPYARPYLRAMLFLGTIRDTYGCDSARDIVARFLCNASPFRGETARQLKAELNAHLNNKD